MAATRQVYHVQEELSQQTLAAALRHWLPGKSWQQVRKMIQSRYVQVCGNLCLDAGRRLKASDVVTILPLPAAALPDEKSLRIHFLDEHLVIVEKPPGITTMRHSEEKNWHPKRKQFQPTLDELLPKAILAYGGKKNSKGRLPVVRAVHRLDRDTSGVMAFARTVRAERDLQQQFKEHSTHRRYLAIVQGKLAAQTIESRLVRDRGDGRRGSSLDSKSGKRAVTHVEPIEMLGKYTLISCRLETGRTHQIRIHLAEVGHPVCGEKVYNKPLGKPPISDRSGANRVALHAAELALTHPISKQRMEFQTALPEDLESLVSILRQQGSSRG